MDTDYLTEAAYRVLIGRSGEVSEYLRADIGASATRYPNEDAYLSAMHQFVSQVAEDPGDYLDGWNIDDLDPVVFGAKTAKLAEEIMHVMTTPLAMRGPVPEY
jgi:hypothetical protein